MDLAAKLQVKAGQSMEAVLVPDSVGPLLSEMTSGDAAGEESALLTFVVDRATLDEQSSLIAEAARRDRLTWVAYPKSGRLGTDHGGPS